jgi:rhomboid protease GluP
MSNVHGFGDNPNNNPHRRNIPPIRNNNPQQPDNDNGFF